MKPFFPALKLLFLFFTLLPAGEVFAYSSFIRLSYVRCESCHTSSLGGGMLTPYGKGIGDANSLWKRASDEDSAAEPKWIQGAVYARYLVMEQSGETEKFLMQLDGMANARVSEKLSTELAAGLVPERVRKRPNAPKGVLGKDFVLRKALVAYSVSDEKRIVAGREHLPRALNIDDHTSFLRSQSRQNPTDYPTQIRYESGTETAVFHGAFFAPSFEETNPNREYGLTGRYEKPFTDRFTVGALGLFGQSDTIRREQFDLFTRYALTETLGIQADLQFVHRTVRATNSDSDQWILYARPFWIPLEWIELGYVGERYTRSQPFLDEAVQHGPNFYFKFVREFTLILDARYTHRPNAETRSQYLLQFFAQI